MMIFVSKNSVCALFLLFLYAVHHVSALIPYRRGASLYAMIFLIIHDFIRPPYLRLDMMYHHLLSMMLCISVMHQPDISDDMILPFWKTEISTVFLVIRTYGVRHWCNDVLFISTFAYYRIFGLTRLLWTSSVNMSLYDQVLGWNLVGLNAYWMTKIMHNVMSIVNRHTRQ